ncbi:MAG: ABC transporter ATP-binding protein [Acidimicrobiia bacterium]
MEPVISLRQVRKTFGSTVALDGLDLEVAAGEVHGYLGPNGAGKSVTIRVLLGLLRRDAGEARLFGADPWPNAVALHRRLAYVPGDVSLWPNLSGGEAIDVLASLRGGIDRLKRDELIERFELDPRKKASTYSKGNRQKVALVAGLASDAELLILDEPTSGLDPLMESVFQECILEKKAEGRTVLLSSHILAEVEKLCDRLTIIRLGRSVEQGTLAELRHITSTSYAVETERPIVGLESIPGVRSITVDGSSTTFEADGDAVNAVFDAVHAAGVRSLFGQPPTLEQLFLRHYETELNGIAAGAGL